MYIIMGHVNMILAYKGFFYSFYFDDMKSLLCLGHLVQQVLSDGLLLHFHGNAIGGVVTLHVNELCLIGCHTHHPFLSV